MKIRKLTKAEMEKKKENGQNPTNFSKKVGFGSIAKLYQPFSSKCLVLLFVTPSYAPTSIHEPI